ncbi:MAG: hypothetical protein M3Q55_09175 [Acidobacteriota bacterium]|nr:hypothetical protein [Acidobacteriota bacterium]
MTTEKKTAAKSLKPSQLETLRFAAQHPHITMPQLAAQMQIRSTSARSRVAHLMTAGCLKSKHLKAEKRGDAKLGFFVTSAGRSVLTKSGAVES